MVFYFWLSVAYAEQWCLSDDVNVKHTVNVLVSITGSKNCEDAFRVLKNQKSLDLSDQELETIAPLQNFDFSVLLLRNNKISDISYLQGHTHLKWLDLSYNPIQGLNTVTFLTSLQTLWLEGVLLSKQDLQPDILCQNEITHLSLRGSGISSVEPLKTCTDLVFLGLANNRIADLTPLKGLKQINTIDLDGNPIVVCPESAVTDLLSKCKAILKHNEQQ